MQDSSSGAFEHKAPSSGCVRTGDLVHVPFEYAGRQVRTVTIQGEPWFVAADVCAVLGYSRVADALRIPDADDLGTQFVRSPDGKDRPAQVINESGLYDLIMGSKRPDAKAFKRWVTHEVLPTIRRTGSYAVAAAPTRTLPRTYAEALRELAGEVEAHELEAQARRVAEQRVTELEPDAARARKTMDIDGLSLIGAVAKRFGIKEKALREFLYAEKLLIRGGTRHNEPMATHVQAGHFEVKVRLVETNPDLPAQQRTTTYVTPKGEALIWKRLYDAGYVASPRMPAQQLLLTP